MMNWRRIALAASLAGASFVACIEHPYDAQPTVGVDPAYGIGVDAGVISGDGAPSAAPMLAKIDPGASMVQTPGQGVGVFVQYDPTSDAGPGGHWYIWWTCDTLTSGQTCPFTVTASVAHGDVTKATTEGFAASDQLSGGGADAGLDGGGGDGASVTATTTTSTTVQGMRFDTAPGAIITLSAALGGEYSGSFLFFVQDGKVNGGYKGTLTDPLELQSSTP